MLCIGVELGPYGDHEAAVHCVHVVQHLFRIRIAGLIECVTSPLVVFPVLPVLHYIVHRNVAAAYFGQGSHQVFLRAVAFTALPEAKRPFGHNLRLAG